MHFLQTYPYRVLHFFTWSWPTPELILLGGLLFLGLLIFAFDLLEYRSLLSAKVTYLELTPQAFSDKTPLATHELFSVLHHVRTTRTFLEVIRRHRIVLSLEITSARADGIRFIARVPNSRLSTFRHTLETYSAGIKVKILKDYLPAASLNETQTSRILTFKQAQHYAYSLQTPDTLAQHDPVGYITGTMTGLDNNELVALQLVLTPVKPRSAKRARNKLISGQMPKLHKSNWLLPLRLFGSLMFIIGRIGMFVVGLISEVTRPTDQIPRRFYEQPRTPIVEPPASPAAQAVRDSLHEKLSQPLFATDMRVLIITNTKQEAKERTGNIISSLATLRVPGLQTLIAHSQFPRIIKNPFRLWQFRHRLPSFWPSSSLILSSAELATLYHFPHSISAKTENVVKSMSKTLPASVQQKNGNELDVIIGENHHHGTVTPIGLTAAERERHMYIVGGTGNGKTTMLLYSIMQDIKSGKGLAVIDPHGDLATTILEHIPKNRINDVIYLNPDDISHPIGINLLELPEGLNEDYLTREKDLVTEQVISVLRKVFSNDDNSAFRIDYILRNSIHTAYTTDKANIFTVFRLLTDPKFRKATVRNLEDGDLKNFWRNELGKAGEFQRVKMSAGVTAKIGRFLFSAPAKRMLEQEKSTIDFDNLMQDGKILICNFSKGMLGEDTSALFGTTILAKLQLAAVRRARISETKRHPFYLYVDEFQNFATKSFSQMFSEARKYKLFLTMAEQSTSQQHGEAKDILGVILSSAGTVVAFRTGNPADEHLILPRFKPFLDEGEIASQPTFSFYVKIAATEVQEPISGTTILLEDNGSETIARRIIQRSQKVYGRMVMPKFEQQIKATKDKATVTEREKELIEIK